MKTVTHIEEVAQPRPIGSKSLHVVRTDDGSVYEFGELPGDVPSFERRWIDGRPSTSRAKFPQDVEESLDKHFGEDGWRK